MHSRRHALARSLRRFAADPSGAQLVEFAIVLPIMLLVFAVIVEGGRLMWSYQTVVGGVRDATRYLARVVPRDVCNNPGTLVEDYEATLTNIVRNAHDGATLLPGGVTINSVLPSLDCITGDFRTNVAPIVTVRASVTVTFPFAGLFAFAGGSRATLASSVTDQSRVYGS